MKVAFCLVLQVLFLALLGSSALFAAESRRADCGEYSFEMPPGYELRHITIDEDKFNRTLTLNEPFEQKDLLAATVTCVREKKTEYQNFSLPNKEKINYRTAARRSQAQMSISATENASHDNMWIKFSLLEERTTNVRVVSGRERFMVAIEMEAMSDDWHTMLFVSDFRQFDGFFDTDEYKSAVTGTATQVMDSIKKRLP